MLTELDAALNMIQDEDKNYSQRLHEQFLSSAETNSYLTAKEKQELLKDAN